MPSPAGDATDLFSLERKVRFGFALAAVALIAVGILTYISVLRFRQDAGLVDHTHQVLNALSELRSSITAAESGQRGYIITGREEYLQSYQASVQAVDQNIQRLDDLTADNLVQQQNLNSLKPLVAQRLALIALASSCDAPRASKRLKPPWPQRKTRVSRKPSARQ